MVSTFMKEAVAPLLQSVQSVQSAKNIEEDKKDRVSSIDRVVDPRSVLRETLNLMLDTIPTSIELKKAFGAYSRTRTMTRPRL